MIYRALIICCFTCGAIQTTLGIGIDTPETIFHKCDIDVNGYLSEAEFTSCFSNLQKNEKDIRTNSPKLFSTIDSDGDGALSLIEYNEMVSYARKAMSQRAITLKNRHGEEENISMEELMQRSENMNPAFNSKDGKMFQESSASTSLDDLAKTNPDIARFTTIGKWVQSELEAQGHCRHGSLSQLRSLPFGGSVNRGKEQFNQPYNQSDKYSMWIELSIRSPRLRLGPNEQTSPLMDYFEVELEMNKSRYPKPYFAIIHAWKLNTDGNRIESIPVKPPRLRIFTEHVVNKILVFLLSLLVGGLLIVLFICSQNSRKSQNT